MWNALYYLNVVICISLTILFGVGAVREWRLHDPVELLMATGWIVVLVYYLHLLSRVKEAR